MNYLKTHKFLVEGKKPGFKASRAFYHALARKIGLTGSYSPHSLRYRYACDKLIELREAGVSKNRAMAMCAEYLGHGPTRTQFVSTVYGKTVVSSFPKTRRRRSYAAAAEEVNSLLAEVFPACADVSDGLVASGIVSPDRQNSDHSSIRAAAIQADPGAGRRSRLCRVVDP